MHFCILLFQVIILFVALGVFLLRVRELFVQNSLIDLRVLREIFLIIAGMYNPVIMSFSRHCSEHCRKKKLKEQPLRVTALVSL